MFSTKLIELTATKTTEELLADINVSNRIMVKNAIFRAKRDLDFTAITELQNLLRALGGEVKGGKVKKVKDLPSRLAITIDPKNDMFNELVFSHCQRVGQLVETKGNVYTYAFKKDDAKKMMDKLGSAKELKIAPLQSQKS